MENRYSNHNHIHIEISTSSILKAVAIILAVIFIYILKDVFIVFLFALIIASAITPFADWLDSKGLPRLLGVLMLYLTVFGLVIFVLSLVIPFISNDLSQLNSTLPKIVEKLSTSLENVQKGSPQYLDFISEIQNLLESFSAYLQQSSQSVISLVVNVFGGLLSFIAIIISSFYLTVMKKGIESFIESVVPSEYEPYVLDLWKRSEAKVGRWMQGQLLLALIVGLIVYVGLSLMGIKFALILGIMAMALEVVPMVGPVLAAIPAVFLAFLQDPSMALWVILFYVVMQQFESHVLVPVVLSKAVGLNPVVVIIALLVGAQLAGITGMFISVPVATIIVEMIDDVAKQKESKKAV